VQSLKIHKGVCLIGLFGIAMRCVEIFDAQTKEFEDILVVNAMLTDEVKRHAVPF